MPKGSALGSDAAAETGVQGGPTIWGAQPGHRAWRRAGPPPASVSPRGRVRLRIFAVVWILSLPFFFFFFLRFA